MTGPVTGVMQMRLAAPKMGAVVTWLTIASLFVGGLKVTAGIDLRLSYLFVILAFGAILLLFEKPVLPVRPLTILWGWLFYLCLATLAVAPPLLFAATLPQVVGIGFFATFFFVYFRNARIDAVRLFEIYVDVAVVIALIGLPIFLWTGITQDFWRLHSLFAEPAIYATATTPATAYALAKARQAPGRAAILSGAMLLTLSLTGFIGLGLSLALVIGRRWWTKLLLALFGLLLLAGAYSASPEIRMRIDDTAQVASTADFAGANLSTYALLSNLWVAWSAFSEHPLVGGGLGSHPFSHDRFIGKLVGLGELEDYIEQNKQDANSLLARTLSEQGLVGIVLLIFFLWRFYRAADPAHQPINAAILVYFLLKLIRDGHYFTPEFFFMVAVYIAVAQGRPAPA